jgi:two-component system CheB/CheR fusion protein
VFLDDKLNIKRFTTQAKKVFSLIESDIGRPISDLSANLRDESLVVQAREVLRTLIYHEREIQTKEGAWRMMRIMPYRTHDNLIDGLVLTFVDIDRIKRIEEQEQAARARAEALVDAVPLPVLVLEATGLKVLRANRAFYTRFRANPKAVAGETCPSIFDERWPAGDALAQLKALASGESQSAQLQLRETLPRVGAVSFEVTAERLDVKTEPAWLVLSLRERPA